MGFFDFFSASAKATALYKRGMEKAESGDLIGAIKDYDNVVANRRCPDDVKAMALFNRGLAFYLQREFQKAKKDFEVVAGMVKGPAKVVAAAQEKLKRMQSKADRP